MEGRHGEDAVRQLADTYRNFAKKHRELYWLIMAMSAKDKRVRDDAAVLSVLAVAGALITTLAVAAFI